MFACGLSRNKTEFTFQMFRQKFNLVRSFATKTGSQPPRRPLGLLLRLGLGLGIAGAGVYAAGLGFYSEQQHATPEPPKRQKKHTQEDYVRQKSITFDPEKITVGLSEDDSSPAHQKSTTFDPAKYTLVFVLGGPGSGKGTQCENIVLDFGFVHLSAGDLLRAERKRPGSQYGNMINEYIKEGLIVPMEVTISLLENAMKESKSNRFLIDGFPRAMDQALQFERQVVPSSLILYFECPETVMLERLLKRGETSGRVDDNIESIKKRFRTFTDTSYPVIEHYAKEGKVCKISCVNAPGVVYQEVKQAIKRILESSPAENIQ